MHKELHILKLFALQGMQLRSVVCVHGMDGGCSCEVRLSAFTEALNIPFRAPKRSVARFHWNQRQTVVPTILCCHFRKPRLS
jgi:hypothetical protein